MAFSAAGPCVLLRTLSAFSTVFEVARGGGVDLVEHRADGVLVGRLRAGGEGAWFWNSSQNRRCWRRRSSDGVRKAKLLVTPE